jgi:hypothetical protein
MPTEFRRAARAWSSVVTLMVVLASVVSVAQASAQPPRQDEFVPIDQLPPTEQMPAAPLVVGAYVFVLVALFVYVVSVARRMSAVQLDVARLEGQLKSRAGAEPRT